MLGLILPILALIIMVSVAACGWLIFKPDPHKPNEPRRPTARRPRR